MNTENIRSSSSEGSIPKHPIRGDAADAWLPVKTPEGRAEIKGRSRAVSQRLRAVLLLIDGERTIAQIRHIASQIGAPETCLDDLLELGLVALPVVPAPEAELPIDLVESDHFELEFDSRRLTSALMDERLAVSKSEATRPARLDTAISSLFPLLESAFGGLVGGPNGDKTQDAPLEEARRILIREVRAKAPVKGAMTLVKLRRVITREDLLALFDEVGSQITGPTRRLSTQQTLLSVKSLLERPM